jgi:ketosteroid isomerase-like protein
MPEREKVEVVRAALDAWNRRDLEALRALSEPGVEWVNSPTAVEPGIRRGQDAFESVVREQWDIMLDGRHVIDHTYEHGDAIFTVGRLSRRMPESESTLEGPVLMSWDVHDGRLARIEVLGFGAAEVEAGLRAAGLA